ncbi:vacuolar protein sorting-associated protein 53 homolog [Lepeophtheirus salmonis]|nr:vacuolar protein sorting-associated protein 53 homolog [Lepeophtheirus salmonis]
MEEESGEKGDGPGLDSSSIWDTLGLDSLGDSVIRYPPEVEEAIAKVLPSDDPLDSPDFNDVDYINSIFPTEQSLTNLDDVISDMTDKITLIDEDIRRIVRGTSAKGPTQTLEEARDSVLSLFSKIKDIQAKAAESEATVREITQDIRQLDVAKKNLTSAITTLNHLHMLVGGVNQLEDLKKSRKYGEAALLIQGLTQVALHFEPYLSVPEIKDLTQHVKKIKVEFGEQITQDFHNALSSENAKNFAPTRQLSEGCEVISVLEPHVKYNLIKWLLKVNLAEYIIIFKDEEAAWMDRIDERYNWIKSSLIEFEERIGAMFPSDWEMSERIAVEFCDITRKDLEKIMFRRKLEIDTKLLLHAIQRTTNFESLISRRFTGATITQYKEQRQRELEAEGNNPFEEEEPIKDENNPFYEASPSTKKIKDNLNVSLASPFEGLISSCFEPYLNIYIESQDRNLADLIERASEEQRQRGSANLAAEGSAVLNSCGDLFMFYKKCMKQCTQLSTGEPMIELATLFKKYLREYATKVLIANLPSVKRDESSGTKLPNIKDFSSPVGFLQNFQSFLATKEGDSLLRLTSDDKVLVCTFLITSEYCLETTQQLEGKLKDIVDKEFVNKINLGQEIDVFQSVVTSCICTLVQDMESSVGPFINSMIKVNWSGIEAVGDQSHYVSHISNVINETVPIIRNNLTSSKKYFTQFCVKFVNGFIPNFLMVLYKCKPLGTVGTEQLLLDTHSIKTALLNLPCAGISDPGSLKAPSAYTKIVVKGMTRAEMTLKVIMSHSEPMADFVQQFMKLIPEADVGDFMKVLDMKGVKKVEQIPYIDLFKTTAPTHLTLEKTPGESSNTGGEESRIKKLEKLMKYKF